jgi:co-chaperonin GroES (HSP10)
MIKPAPGYAVVQPKPAAKMTPGGLHIPEAAVDTRMVEGVVLEVAKRVERIGSYSSMVATDEAPWLKSGDSVLFDSTRAREIEHCGERLAIIEISGILATLA